MEMLIDKPHVLQPMEAIESRVLSLNVMILEANLVMR